MYGVLANGQIGLKTNYRKVAPGMEETGFLDEITPTERESLRILALNMRQDIITMQQRGTGVASAMSIVDLLAVLYFKVMRIPTTDDPDRDRFILSKGHATSAIYSVLAHKGFLDPGRLATFLRDQSVLMGHPSRQILPGIETSSGSLGHGLAIGVGIAHGAKLDRRSFRAFVLLGDGELQEGSVWEAANLASRLGLDNLVAIVDANGLQGYDRVDNQMPLSSLADKWRAFGWHCLEIDGHDHASIAQAFVGCSPGRPTAVIAHTVKGKGVGEMEDTLGWHYFNVSPEKSVQFSQELERQK